MVMPSEILPDTLNVVRGIQPLTRCNQGFGDVSHVVTVADAIVGNANLPGDFVDAEIGNAHTHR
jgi:hypothetical protein